MGGEPTQRCRSTLAPFRVGAGPPGPIPAANCRVPQDHPPCRSRCSAAHPMGSLLMGKALACARRRGPLLSCSSLHPSRGCGRGHVWHAPFGSTRHRASPLSHICVRVTARAFRLRVSAGPRPGFQRTLSCFAGSVNLGGLGGIRQETVRMGKEIADGSW